MNRIITIRPVDTGLMIDTGGDTSVSVTHEAIQDNARIELYAYETRFVTLFVELTEAGDLKLSAGTMNTDLVWETLHETENNGSLTQYQLMLKNNPSNVTVEVV